MIKRCFSLFPSLSLGSSGESDLILDFTLYILRSFLDLENVVINLELKSETIKSVWEVNFSHTINS